jgi:type IV secretion system protein VirB9
MKGREISMTRTIGYALSLLILAGTAFAQTTTVPAIPGAAPPTPDQIRAQLQATNEQLAKLRESMAQAQGLPQPAGLPAPAGAMPIEAPAMPSAYTASLLPSTDTLSRRRTVPHTPTAEEVDRLEQQLSRARAQRRAESVADAGTITATSASEARSVVVFPFVENSIYEIYTAPDRMTAIELQPGETISTENGKPKAADTVQWIADTVSAGEGATRKTIVMVKPILTGIETNMLIPTNRRIYSIVLRSASKAYMPLVAFNYPNEEASASAAKQAARDSTREPVGTSPENMNFAYRIKGKKEVWTPLRVFDDGTKTYLQMSPEMHSWESPALFVIEDKKVPELVNYRVKGDYYIVDRLFHQAELRIGTKQFVDIYRDRHAGG